jgi:hypothetical protein
MDALGEMLTVADVARVMRCSRAHVCKLINGQVTYAMIGARSQVKTTPSQHRASWK